MEIPIHIICSSVFPVCIKSLISFDVLIEDIIFDNKMFHLIKLNIHFAKFCKNKSFALPV